MKKILQTARIIFTTLIFKVVKDLIRHLIILFACLTMFSNESFGQEWSVDTLRGYNDTTQLTHKPTGYVYRFYSKGIHIIPDILRYVPFDIPEGDTYYPEHFPIQLLKYGAGWIITRDNRMPKAQLAAEIYAITHHNGTWVSEEYLNTHASKKNAPIEIAYMNKMLNKTMEYNVKRFKNWNNSTSIVKNEAPEITHPTRSLSGKLGNSSGSYRRMTLKAALNHIIMLQQDSTEKDKYIGNLKVDSAVTHQISEFYKSELERKSKELDTVGTVIALSGFILAVLTFFGYNKWAERFSGVNGVRI
ncbi:hypothetical protein ACFQ3S_17375 [Mucilaginibacter terrae]|uniref:hypothetical protein n=1 Tax=Mucilaginibacter terrae TaxID=1955052 RepID=UPI00363F67E3